MRAYLHGSGPASRGRPFASLVERDVRGTRICDKHFMGTLLVAGAGGHLAEMRALRDRFTGVDGDMAWVTWPTSEASSLLECEKVYLAAYPPPRNLPVALSNARFAYGILRTSEWRDIVTTGSSLAVSFLAVGRALGYRCHFVESATRTSGPSLAGRLLERVPGVALYTQCLGWRSRSWAYEGSVFDGFCAERSASQPIEKVVVTLGSTPRYGFRRLVEALARLLPPGASVLWQTGPTDVAGLGIDASAFVSANRLRAAISEADLVVAHAGVGSALEALSAGRCPVLVPRRKAFGEHVDDHQSDIAAELAGRGLCIAREADELSEADLLDAAARTVRPPAEARPFRLRGARDSA